ncbi:hypothetical protein [Paenibacillus polymyxa]|uniref:hypothetical protein n=1 Tax=Paenibacillus polymyxa TaxID=1406 RepID=UPI002378F8C7|nr:hypothetical protein [Paenibacillus polymyxa]WDM20361.1 hypothetical protein J4I02_14950 [Paenibacillus polymyxa]
MTEDEKDYYKSKIDYNKWVLGIISILLGFTITLYGKIESAHFLFILIIAWASLGYCFFTSYGLLRMYSFVFENKLLPEKGLSQKNQKMMDKQPKDEFRLSKNQAYSFFVGHLSILIFILLNLIF